MRPSWIRVGLKNNDNRCPLSDGKEENPEEQREEGRVWSYVVTNQGIPGASGSWVRQGRFPFETSGGAQAFTSDFWPPEPQENTFLLF